MIEVEGRVFENHDELIKDYVSLRQAFSHTVDEVNQLREALTKLVHYVEVTNDFDSIKGILK